MNNVDIGQKYKRIVQYFWDPEPKNDDDSNELIWCLGKSYKTVIPPHSQLLERPEDSGLLQHTDTSDPKSLAAASHETPPSFPDDKPFHFSPRVLEWPDSFLDDFEARVWMTYRSGFPAIPKATNPSAPLAFSLSVRLRSQLLETHGFTTDTGWGCMIRSGQSLLANALFILHLGRDWRRGSKTEEECALLSLFADDPQAPLSIHRFVEHGASACGKHPGEWFGPSATARCIEALSSDCKDVGLNVYVTSDGSDVYEEQFFQIAGAASLQPTLILLGVRLGIENVNPVYWEALKAIMRWPQSLGIAGGRPSSSHYFVGVQGEHFFYLDPHHTRPAPAWKPESTPAREDINTYHTRRLRRLHIREMDPSMLIGFLIRNNSDWLDWKERVRGVPGKAIIHVFDGGPPHFGKRSERKEAVDEVEALDDDVQDELL